jgi:predicted transcriptional regulator
MFDCKSTPCPICSDPIKVTRNVFTLDFPCPHCGAKLKVSPLYAQLVVLLGVLLGYALAWVATMRGPRSCFMDIPSYFYLLCLPFTFLILPFLCWIAPFLIRPSLVPRQSFESHLTTLNLTPDREAIAAQIEEGFAQAERGELMDADQATRTLQDRRAKRLIA